MPTAIDPDKLACDLLLFVATSDEEKALRAAVLARNLPYEKIKHDELGEYRWLGRIGSDRVIAIPPARGRSNHVVMGALGRLGTASRAIRLSRGFQAQGIVQLGMAFGINPTRQKLGDVLVSTSLIAYDNRRVRGLRSGPLAYETDYSGVLPENARPALVELFREEAARPSNRQFAIHLGPLLSGAARVQSRAFRNELVAGVPKSEVEIVGGEMEGVGLSAASESQSNPIWCVVKGISDFADEERDAVIQEVRVLACRNAAEFVLSALVNSQIR